MVGRVVSRAVVTAVACAMFVTGAARAEDGTHIVEPGDTLAAIAADHGVSVDDLAAVNGIAVDQEDVLSIG